MLEVLSQDASGAAAANPPHVRQAAKASQADAVSPQRPHDALLIASVVYM
jgi:hypothetical protein